MIKRFLRVFICLSILLVIAFQQSACTIIDDMVERKNQEYQKQKEFCEQYMQSIPVDEEGYEISKEEGIQTCYYADMERTILDDGETVFDYIKKVGLVLENNGERKLIGFEFLVEKSEKFRMLLDMWHVYNGNELGDYQSHSSFGLRVCTDGTDIYYVYFEYYYGSWNSWFLWNIFPILFKYDISEDKILYLGYYPKYELEKGEGDWKVLINK